MKIAVCDDNENELTRIKELLDAYASRNNQNFIIKCFSSSVELASTAEFEKYDIYILDIIMPVITCNISYIFTGICSRKLHR